MERAAELAGPLEHLPPVEFCCAYGSSLLPNSSPKGTMVDYILGVSDPVDWHSQNLERNRKHYSNYMARFGPKAITGLADKIGAGVHFNPFVQWKDKMIKYGVVNMHDLAIDVLSWNQFYLSGRLQKPMCIIIDNWDINKINTVNLKSALSASFLLLPEQFTEEELYATICGLSYMGDLRMLFAEDKNKVKNIVQGSFELFQSMYKPLVHEYVNENLLKVSSRGGIKSLKQDCGSFSTNYHFSSLPWTIQKHVRGTSTIIQNGIITPEIIISSKGEAAKCVTRGLRRAVMVSSTRQAVSGLIATGGLNAAKYLSRKISKAWNSRISN